MVVEEPSIVAAVSSAAKIVRGAGGFKSVSDEPVMIGQVQIVDADHPTKVQHQLLHKKDEIIASVKKGLYAETFTNGQVLIGAGDFTFYVKSGDLIENGKLTKPVKDVNIIGNGPDVLKNIVMVADDLKMAEGGWTCGKNGQGVPVSQGLPTVKVSKITVGGIDS